MHYFVICNLYCVICMHATCHLHWFFPDSSVMESLSRGCNSKIKDQIVGNYSFVNSEGNIEAQMICETNFCNTQIPIWGGHVHIQFVQFWCDSGQILRNLYRMSQYTVLLYWQFSLLEKSQMDDISNSFVCFCLRHQCTLWSLHL